MTIASLNWWNSTETLSKVLNYLAVLVTLSGVATVTLKLRYDHLKKLADKPRQIAQQQRDQFIKVLADVPKGSVKVAIGEKQNETIQFFIQVQSLLRDAGFSVSDEPEYALGYAISPPLPGPWFVAFIVDKKELPVFAGPLYKAFHDIGINAAAIPGEGRIKPMEVKVYIGSK